MSENYKNNVERLQQKVKDQTDQLRQITAQLHQERYLRQKVETSFHACEDKFFKVFRASPVPIVLTQLTDSRLLDVNDSFLDLLGYEGNEVIGHTAIELNMWVNPEERTQLIQQVQEAGVVRNQEIDVYTSSGEVRTVLFSADLIDLDGQPCLLSTANDITERKQRELLQDTQNAVLKMVAQGRSLSDILVELTTRIDNLTPKLCSSILLMAEDGEHLRPCASPKLPPAWMKLIDPLRIGPEVGSCGTAAYFGKRVIVEDIANNPLWANFKDQALAYGFRACWSEPIMSDTGKVLGTFAMYFTEVRSPHAQELEAIESLAWLTSLVIQRKQAEAEQKRTEAALYQSNTILRSIIESTPDVIFVKDEQGRYILANSTTASWLEMTVPEMLGQDDTAWFPAEIAQHIRETDRAVMTTGEPKVYEDLFPRQSIMHTLLTTKCPWRDEQGKIIGVIGICRDISDRKRAEFQLRSVTERLEYLLTSSPAVIFSFRTGGNYETTFMSENVSTIFGYPAQAFISDANFWKNRVHPEDRDRIFSKGFSQLFLQGSDSHEYRFLHADGTYRWVYAQLRLVKDDDGNPIESVGYWVDISERKIGEQKLHETTALYQQILDAIPDLILCKGLQSHIIYANKAFRDYYGMTMEQLQCIIDAPRVNPDYTQQYVKDDAYVFNTGQTLWIDEPAVRYDGQEYLFSTVKTAIRDATGQVIQTVGVSRDITEQKQAEDALRQSEARFRDKATELEHTLDELKRTQAQLIQTEKLSSLGQMLAGIAHEINNPVNFIYANINPAMEYATDLLDLLELYQQHYREPVAEIQEELEAIEIDFIQEDFPKLLASIKEGANRITQIVLSLRNFSRLDAKDLQEVDIHEGIDNTLLILRNRLKQQHHRCEIQVIKEYGQLPAVLCYPGQLNQVFMNLLSNAIDTLEESQSSEQRSPRIEIRTQLITPDKIAISIADNGSGIPPEVQQQMFDPFFTTKPPGKGTGLGLSISYQIVVEKHQGQLWCNSVMGQGTTFVIELPLGTITDEG
ncbi:MAG TPA: hypothetical protein DDZ80_14815 [Cyanobacteria bacterium UBA8803]|nr:hypothetical protein [Cyanobacteria bacterium UBA9273]HBL59703.1 hypothetical protein [Cyanobacteria bacterium UBA8803]